MIDYERRIMTYFDNELYRIEFKNGRATVYDKDPVTHELTYSRKSQLVIQLVEHFKEHRDQGKVLYALTVTYTKHKAFSNVLKSIRNRFRHLYWDKFLPEVIFKDKDWLGKYGHLQPTMYVFIEEHQPKPHSETSSIGVVTTIFPDNLHHHAILAVNPQIAEEFDKICGENTLKHLCRGIMTTKLVPCDLGWTLYATKHLDKNLKKYEYDFFGPDLKHVSKAA